MKLPTQVEAERSYHRNALDILDKLHSEVSNFLYLYTSDNDYIHLVT